MGNFFLAAKGTGRRGDRPAWEKDSEIGVGAALGREVWVPGAKGCAGLIEFRDAISETSRGGALTVQITRADHGSPLEGLRPGHPERQRGVEHTPIAGRSKAVAWRPASGPCPRTVPRGECGLGKAGDAGLGRGRAEPARLPAEQVPGGGRWPDRWPEDLGLPGSGGRLRASRPRRGRGSRLV